MNEKEINLKSTSQDTAEADPIILRETQTTRLVFKPMIVNNIHDQEASVRGEFVFQKKSPGKEWKDCKNFHLNKMKKDECVKLEMKSGEIKTLYEELKNLRLIYQEHGILRGEHRFYLNESNIPKIIKELAKNKNNNLLIQELNKLTSDELSQLSKNVDLTITNIKRKEAVKQFEKMLNEELSEHDWQEWFKNNNWILGTEFIHIIDERAIDIENISDYLVKAYDGFLDIIEIKKPSENMPFWLENKDHNNLIPSSSLVKAIMQSINYIYAVEKESNSIKFSERMGNIKVIKPRCTLIFGRSNDWDKEQHEAYRILNSSYHNLTILTYDHILSRAKQILG